MSDKRVIITITTSVAAIALVFGLMVGISATPTNITTQSTPLSIMGHFAVTIADSDGNIKAYIQTDNVNSDIVSDCIAADLFAPTVTVDPGCGIFTRIGIGFDVTPELDDNVALALETASARTTCAPVGTPAVGVAGGSTSGIACASIIAHVITAADIAAALAGEAALPGPPSPLTVDRTATPLQAVDCADLSPVDGVGESCEISEIAIFDALVGGNMYGRITIASLAPVPISTAQYVKVGDTVTGTYNTLIG